MDSNLSSRGFTLVEILVSTAIFMVGVLAMSELLRSMRDSSRTGEAMMELASLGSIIRETVRFDSTCTAAMAGLNTHGFDSSSILSGSKEISLGLPGVLGDTNPNDDVLRSNTPVRKLNVTSLRLTNPVDLGSGRYYSNIELSANDRLRDLRLKPIVVGGFFFSTSAGALTSCGTPGVDQANLCAEMSCVYDASASPSCQCPTVDLSCPPQQFLTGVDSTGQLICRPIGNGACPAGTYLRGVGIGTSDCVPLPM